MKQSWLAVVLGALLLTVAGCGGSGGGGSSVLYTIPVNLAYTVNSSSTSSTTDTVTMTITTIEVMTDKTLHVNCTWTAVNKSGLKIVKISDAGKTAFYMYDNNGTAYHHTSGNGAAYSDTELSATAVSGTYYFPAVNSTATALYFKDNDNGKTLGPVTVTWK